MLKGWLAERLGTGLQNLIQRFDPAANQPHQVEWPSG